MAIPLELVGAPGSPYSRKMRALLRYRRIPFRWRIRTMDDGADIPKVAVALIPILVFRGEGGAEDSAMIDSTFQIERLEQLQTQRSVIPRDPALAFISALLEDYGDEWLTKAMFHYRWAYRADIDKAAAILPRWRMLCASDAQIAPVAKMFAERQIARLGVVGSNETTGPVIEDSYKRFLRALDAHLTVQPFLLGRRPAAADFALFGQLTQLAQFDPTSMAVTLEIAPRVYAWVDLLEDESGLEPSDADWNTRDALPDTLRALLCEVGRTYAPFLLGNAAALARADARVECEIDGRKWTQKPFPYQGKCLGWLREGRARLSDPDRAFVDSLLAGTGCETLFSDRAAGGRRSLDDVPRPGSGR